MTMPCKLHRSDLVGCVGVDIGGQSTRIGTVLPNRTLKLISFCTQPDFDVQIDMLVDKIKLLGVDEIRRVGIGSPGPLDWKKTFVYDTPNLPWRNVSFKKLERKLGVEVLLDNDANVAGLGEATLGAGRGKRIVAGFTLGTGIGYFHIIDGHIYHGSLDVEAGHQILDPNGPECNCGQRGCLEAFVSATGIQRRYGVPPHELEDQGAWDDIALRLAQGLVNIALHTSAEVLVLCGGMLARGEMLLKPTRIYYEQMLQVYPKRYRPPVVTAKLGDRAGVYGAIVLAHVGHSGRA
ncbi:MAG: ROK family protein [Armatimonadota bacterium]|nr:ROK family protein [Armatimonadota bacterium]MCX7777241.1 ROK family protein [Armatimonadota bacterium]MDW8024656.1 ROK family protein [Armatimonadota bacterium]